MTYATIARLILGLIGSHFGGKAASSLMTKMLGSGRQRFAGSAMGQGLNALASSARAVSPLGKMVPTASRLASGTIGGAELLGSIGGFIGTDMGVDAIFRGEHPDPDVSDIKPMQPMPGAVNQGRVLSSLRQESQLREVMDLIGVDFDELQSLMTSQQQRMVL